MDIYIKRFLEYKKSDLKLELSELTFVENELLNIESIYDFIGEENERFNLVIPNGYEFITNIEVYNKYRNHLFYQREVLMSSLKNDISNDIDSLKILHLERKFIELEETDVFEFFDYEKEIFKNENAHRLFLEFSKNIANPYIDYSFVFQSLKKDNLIFSVSHNQFIDWLKDNNFIKDKDYEEFKIKRGFLSYDKSKSEHRLNIYINLKERYII